MIEFNDGMSMISLELFDKIFTVISFSSGAIGDEA